MTSKEIRKQASTQLDGYRKKFAIFTLITLSIIFITKYCIQGVEIKSLILYVILSLVGVLSKGLFLNFCINNEFDLNKGIRSFKVYIRYFIIIFLLAVIVATISFFIVIIVSATGVVSFFDIIYNAENIEAVYGLVIGFVIVLLISISLIIIILQLFFFATPYLIIEGYGLEESLYTSLDLMEDNKFRLLKLELSFIGWIVLTIITFGIALLWVGPYIAVAKTKFYLMILKEKNIVIS
ncbi:MAG: DUF975 family protein [Clostridium sp.]|uniref:DUF975 family protein n=1 Tax=Clostridium sp. TaxID=1506 RepID=UPI003F4015A7